MEQQDQVTLTPKLIFQKIIQAKDLILKNWWIILLLIGVGIGVGYFMDIRKNKRVQYEAKIVFSISNGTSGGQDMGGFGGFLGMSAPTNDAALFRGENLFYILKTRPVLERILLSEVTLSNGQKTSFINYYLDSTYIRQDEWMDFLPEWTRVRITKNNRSKMVGAERQVFDGVLFKIRDRELFISQPNTKTAFYELIAYMENEMVAKTFADLTLKTVGDVYQETQTRKTREMMIITKRRVDSLASVLNRTENRLAQTTIINTDAVMPTAKVAEGRLTRNSTFVSSLYLEASRNLENLQMSIIKEAPLFNEIEPISMPLPVKALSRENTKFGGIIGLLVAIMFILIKDTYLEAVRDLKKK